MSQSVETRAETTATRVLHRAIQTRGVMCLLHEKGSFRVLTWRDAEAIKPDPRTIVGYYDRTADRQWILDDIFYVLRGKA
jgi:muramoyltetrapeptide carboxypeptidase LdcA involved in peptidoglycan recycling